MFNLLLILVSISYSINFSIGGGGTMLQAGRSRVRFPKGSLIFSSAPDPSSHTITVVFTQPLT
jgi:hypothetical protein